jgi:hypothetical protein
VIKRRESAAKGVVDYLLHITKLREGTFHVSLRQPKVEIALLNAMQRSESSWRAGRQLNHFGRAWSALGSAPQKFPARQGACCCRRGTVTPCPSNYCPTEAACLPLPAPAVGKRTE